VKMTVNSIYFQDECMEIFLHSPIRLNCVVLKYSNFQFRSAHERER
jgi:hypothetical protein